MLLRFIAENIYSFKGSAEFNTFPSSKSHSHEQHKISCAHATALRLGAIYGANGAGKSNLLSAIKLLKDLVTFGSLNKVYLNGGLNFRFDPACREKPSGLAIEFYQNEKVFYYHVEFKDRRVVLEELLLSKKTKDIIIFKREDDEIHLSGDYLSGMNDSFMDALDRLVRPDMLLLSFFGEYYPAVEDAAEGFGSKFNGQVLGTFGKYGVLSFNGNKMITTSGGGALITENEDEWREIMMYATQYRESYPYYQHEKIGYNYRMSNICAGIGRGQMTVVNDHISHHKHVQKLYEELFKDVKGVTVHSQPATGEYDSNFWLCTITLDPDVKIKGQENAYKTIVKGAVGGAAGVIHVADSATTDCQPNDNVEALRVFMDQAGIEARPVWKPMHKQPCYKDVPAYVNGVSEAIFKVGMCLPAGPYVTDEDVKYIVDTIKAAIV